MRCSIAFAIACSLAAQACAGSGPRRVDGGIPPTAWCAEEPTDVRGLALGLVRGMASSGDQQIAAFRKRIADMPRVPAEQVTQITDAALCEAASRALAAQHFTRGSASATRFVPVLLFRAGPRLIVVPQNRDGGFATAVHFDADFRKLAVSTF